MVNEIRQSCDSVLMVRPAHFGSNPETGASNVFQASSRQADPGGAAVKEFDGVVSALRGAGVTVLALDGRDRPALPDEVFPNNWFSTHEDGTLVLYPMESPLRRQERRPELKSLLTRQGFTVNAVEDLTAFEAEGTFLEGTGSLVLDHSHRYAYACRSTRTNAQLTARWADRMGYEPCLFDARYAGRPIYHTNVMLSLGSGFAVLAAETVEASQRPALLDRIRASGRELILISAQQMASFAANILELEVDGRPWIALSQRAADAFDPAQRAVLERHGRLLPMSIPTIEAFGGGSLRCMLAEIRLPKRGSR